MTLEQLETELPNGLHDAKIQAIERDFERETVMLAVRIWVGQSDGSRELREMYRNGKITFTHVKVCVVEPPDASSPFLIPGEVFFSASRGEAGSLPQDVMCKLPPSSNVYSLFVLDWLSSIHIACSDLAFAWD